MQAYFTAHSTIVTRFTIAQSGPFAVYSATDHSLTFYDLSLNDQFENRIYVGETYDGKVITAMYRGICLEDYEDRNKVPWISDGYAQYIERVEFAGTTTPVSTAHWFSGLGQLTSVEGTDKLDLSMASSTERMFSGCSKLARLDLSGGKDGRDMKYVETMEGMFENCMVLEELDISGWHTSLRLKNTKHMFDRCRYVQELDFGEWVATGIEEHDGMFDGCNYLRQVTINATCAFVAQAPLPAPSGEIIQGTTYDADGKWYDKKTGMGYEAADIPYSTIKTGETATYSALRPENIVYGRVDMGVRGR